MQKIKEWYLPDSDVHFRAILERTGNYIEEHLVKALEFVTDWENAIDVGAHIGLCSKILAEKFKTVWAFEPAPDTFECLTKNMEGIDNAVLYQVAIGAETGTVRMEDDISKPTRIGNTGARFVRDGGIIAMYPLDFFHVGKVGFIKIDVEGYELRVLEGARGTIEQYRPVVMIEVGKSPEERYGLKGRAPVEFLESLGMREVLRVKPDWIFAW